LKFAQSTTTSKAQDSAELCHNAAWLEEKKTCNKEKLVCPDWVVHDEIRVGTTYGLTLPKSKL